MTFHNPSSDQAQGTSYAGMMHAMDWTPTLANITGIPTVRNQDKPRHPTPRLLRDSVRYIMTPNVGQ